MKLVRITASVGVLIYTPLPKAEAFSNLDPRYNAIAAGPITIFQTVRL